MPKAINPAIGSCPCPVCGQDSQVKRFNVRALTATRARRGGRLYVECKRHGTFTSPAEEMQEWILERAAIWGPDGKPREIKETEMTREAPARPVPVPGAFETPDQPAAPEKHGGWGFFK